MTLIRPCSGHVGPEPAIRPRAVSCMLACMSVRHADTTRVPEEIGYLVIESGTGSIGGLGFVAGVGAETVTGPDNGTPVTYPLLGLASTTGAIVSVAGMNGVDGGWPVLAGSSAVTPRGLQLFFEEDRWTRRRARPQCRAGGLPGLRPIQRAEIAHRHRGQRGQHRLVDGDVGPHVQQYGRGGQCQLRGGRSTADHSRAAGRGEQFPSPGAAR